jgi:hypothetical protein
LGLAWEAGALKVSFRPDRQYQYHEFYAGLARDRVVGNCNFQLAVLASAPRRRASDAARALALTATYAF